MHIVGLISGFFVGSHRSLPYTIAIFLAFPFPRHAMKTSVLSSKFSVLSLRDFLPGFFGQEMTTT
jgi:hypothetical protein